MRIYGRGEKPNQKARLRKKQEDYLLLGPEKRRVSKKRVVNSLLPVRESEKPKRGAQSRNRLFICLKHRSSWVSSLRSVIGVRCCGRVGLRRGFVKWVRVRFSFCLFLG